MTSRYLRRRAKDPELPPGSLIYSGPPRDHPIEIRQVLYGVDHHSDVERGLEEVVSLGPMATGVQWLEFDGVHNSELIAGIASRFELPALAAEDLLLLGQRPKLEFFEGGVHVLARGLKLQRDEDVIVGEQVSLVVVGNTVLSFHEGPSELFAGVRGRVRAGVGPIRSRGADYLLYALMDALVNGFSLVASELGDRIETLEEASLEEIPDDFPQTVRALRKEAILLRRAIWPLREVLVALLKPVSATIGPETLPFIRDVQDHLTQLVEAADAMKESLTALNEYHVSQVNQKANEIMMVLTLVATIFIPLTFLAGIYGMNFEYMPELGFRWAYPALIIAMVSVGVGLVAIFRRKGWL